MPTPRDDESRDEFVSRCIPIVIEDGTAEDEEQAVAVCNSMWEQGEKMITEDTLVSFGGSVKALGDGVIGGYLVEYTDPEHPDLEADYFDASTDYGPHEKSLAFYHHGADKTLGRRPLSKLATLTRKDAGVWMEHQLDMREEYEAAIYRLAEQGKLGLSSGTAPHLVEREEKGDVYHITRWPLGLDASYTPTPANWQSRVMPLKTYIKSVGSASLLAGDDLAEDEPEAEADSSKGAAATPEAPSEAVAERERAEAHAKRIQVILDMEE